MNTDQLVALCQRHHALLLTSDSDMVSIAVVGSPAAELRRRCASRPRNGLILSAGALSVWKNTGS